MTENRGISENEMAQTAVAWLQKRLPDSWEVTNTARAEFQSGGARGDAAIDLRGPNGIQKRVDQEELEQLQQLEPGGEAAATRAGRPVRWWWCLCGLQAREIAGGLRRS